MDSQDQIDQGKNEKNIEIESQLLCTPTKEHESSGIMKEREEYSSNNMESLSKKSSRRNFHPIKNNLQFNIDPKNIHSLKKTTLMIRNIPNKYSKG